jgi:predicted PurR-regulated permease PerM
MQMPRPRWSSRTKLTITLLLLGFAVYLLYRFSSVIKPLILAVFLAYALTPAVNLVQRRLKFRRGIATLLIYLIVLVVVATIPVLVFPPLADQVANLNLNLQQVINQIESILGRQYILAGLVIDVDAIIKQFEGLVRGVIQPVFGQTLSLVIDVISSLVWVIFIAVVSFYLVKDSPELQNWLENVIPSNYRKDYVRLRLEINQIWSAFFRGQIVLALIVALIFTAVGMLIGLPFTLAMALLAGLLEFLPSLGHGIWLAIGAILAFFAGSTWIPIPNWVFMLLVIGLHLFFEQFDLNYLIPRVIGRRVHLPPVVVILGIVSGAVLAGVIGVLLAAPTIASARVLGRYIYANLTDQDPFPDTVVPALPPPNSRWWRKKPSPASVESKLES